MSVTSHVYLGCYTKGDGGDGTGIVLAERDRRTGALRPLTVTPTPSPSFVVRHPERPVLYAANELERGELSAFAVEPDGTLHPLGRWDSGGALPCHLAVDSAGGHVLVANYGSGTVAAYALDGQGRPTHRTDVAEHSGLGAHPVRQTGPHAHTVVPDADGVLAVDLGTDAVYRHSFDRASGRLGEGEIVLRLPPGMGPRHLARRGDHLYLVGELDGSIAAFEHTAAGWRERGRVDASTHVGALPSEIAVSADGLYLYVANRVVDTIAVFALTDTVPQRLGEVPVEGEWPRHFLLVDDFLYVANERSHAVVVFRIDPVTGLPVPTGDVLATPSPTCVLAY